MKEAHDHHRVSPEGREIGEQMARLAQREIEKLKAEGEPVECCRTCAFRPGTVPNGCLQTQMDALKCVLEGVPFMCHQDQKLQTVCHGWFAARQARGIKGSKIPCAWDFSPPDDAAAPTASEQEVKG